MSENRVIILLMIKNGFKVTPVTEWVTDEKHFDFNITKNILKVSEWVTDWRTNKFIEDLCT